MPLTSGSRFGAYEVVAALGVGGMGEVYRASDSRLKRQVAIKVLPSVFAADGERVARFQREAEMLAALNHPNIGAIYGIEESDGVTGLVMELIEGPTLADLIAAGPIPVNETMAIATQIAAALEAAHEHNIIHRDLKPANIKVAADGTVKVLDFGLAKSVEAVSSDMLNSPTITSPAMTMRGVVLGTAAYMAPEQARGRVVDRRADIWAFGVVLYEMLTGRRPFEGEDVSLTLAEVMKSDPDFTRLPADVPASLRMCLTQCLQKDPRQRMRDIGDVRLMLNGAFGAASRVDAAGVDRGWGRRRLALVAGLLLVTAGTFAALGWVVRPVPARPITRFQHLLAQRLGGGNRPLIAASRDGRRFVYRVADGFYSHLLHGSADRMVIANLGNISSPAIAPDGNALAFFNGGQLKQVGIDGGAPTTICDVEQEPLGLTWAADNYLYFGSRAGIARVPANGGQPAIIVAAGPNEQLVGPQVLPNLRTVLFSSYNTTEAFSSSGGNLVRASAVFAQSITGGERKMLVRDGANPRFHDGYLLYTIGSTLAAQRFDADSLTVQGSSVTMVESVRLGVTSVGVALANYDVSDDGSLFYLEQPDLGAQMVWVTRDGKAEPIPNLRPGTFNSIRLSPDDRRVATVLEGDVRVYDLDTGRERLLTSDRSAGGYTAWSSDGNRVAYSSTRNTANGLMNVWIQSLAGSGPPEQITKLDALTHVDGWSPDGRTLMLHRHDAKVSTFSMFSLDARPGAQPKPFTSPPGTQEGGVFSPDSKFVAYVDTVTGRHEIVIRALDHSGPVIPVSVGGGREPYWASNGELFYRRTSDDTMMAVPISTTPSISVGIAKALFPGAGSPGGSSRATYAVSADGQRFIMMASRIVGNAAPLPAVSIVLNWANELKARVQ